MTQNPIRLVIFDFDGTLADTSGLIIATMQATLKYMQLPVPTAEQVKRVIGLPLIDCFTHPVPMDDATAQKCSEAYRNIFEEKKNKEILPQPSPMSTPHSASSMPTATHWPSPAAASPIH